MTGRTSETDVALMERVREDDEPAFALLYQRYTGKLQNFFYALGRETDTAEDLAQDTFMRVWRLRRRYAATGPFPAYLFAIARFVWLEHCRRMGREARLGSRFDLDGPTPITPAAPAPRPDERAEQAEEDARVRAVLDAVLDALPDDQRMALVLRIMEGLSLEETASVLQCPVNTVRSRRLAALKKLREALRKHRIHGNARWPQ